MPQFRDDSVLPFRQKADGRDIMGAAYKTENRK